MILSKKRKKLLREEAIIFDKENEGYGKSIEQYTRLKDNILCFAVDGKKVIQVESSVEQEGKTTTTANLAVALGASGKKVVAIDFDFARGCLHRLFLVENHGGVNDYILGNITKEELIKKTSYENVDIITKGHSVKSSSMIFTSQKMIDLIEELKKEYDFILLDCPPVVLVSDYMHIARLSDGVLLVVAYGITKKKYVTDAVNLLRNNNINIIGSVFSYYDPKISSTYYDYNGSYYYYYYQKNDKEKENQG